MLGNNTTRIAICEKKERDDVVVVRFFLYVDKKRGGKGSFVVSNIQKSEVVGSDVIEKRVWVQRLARRKKKVG